MIYGSGIVIYRIDQNYGGNADYDGASLLMKSMFSGRAERPQIMDFNSILLQFQFRSNTIQPYEQSFSLFNRWNSYRNYH
jgi:hypothetical protein